MMRGRHVVVAVAALAWIVVLVAWVGEDPRLAATAYDTFSSFNTSPSGTSQAFAYLAMRHADVRKLTREIAIERPPRDAVIFRVGTPVVEPPAEAEHVEERKSPSPDAKSKSKKPAPKPKTIETFVLLDDQEEAWVRRGGRLVLAPSENGGGIHLDPAKCSAYRQVFPVVPPLPVPSATACHSLSGPSLQHFHSLLINDSGPVLARQPIGAGDVILFSLPEALSNDELSRGANLALLETLAANRRTIYFDETVHGVETESSVLDLLVTDWRLGPALVVLAAAAFALFWRKSRATGAPDRIESDVRSDAVDLVQSLGQLYDRSVDRDEALRLYYQALIRTTHARTGLSGDALDRLVRAKTAGYDAKPHFHDI